MSALYGFDSGAWRTITDVQAYIFGWTPIQEVYANDAGVWKSIWRRNFVFSPTIAVDTLDYNVSTAAIAAGWNGVDPLIATITINAGIYVGSTSTASPAFTVPGGLPAGSTVYISNSGFIVGKGGGGGAGGSGTTGVPQAGGAGAAGGPALSLAYATSVNNGGGVIGGGGGGGGGGSTRSNGDEGGSGGGGGRGLNGGAGGVLGTGSITPGSAGGAGTKTTPGTNVYGPGFGYGGDLGVAGDTGNPDDLGAGAPGARGYYLHGDAFVSWVVVGTRLGDHD